MMKKSIPFLLLFFVSQLLLSQSKVVQVGWPSENTKGKNYVDSKKSSGGIVNTNSRPQSNNTSTKQTNNNIEQIGLNFDERSNTYSYRWKDTRYVNPRSVQIQNIKWAPLTASERSQVNSNLVPDQVEYSLQSVRAKDQLYTNIEVTPVVRRNGVYQKILSFSVDYSYGNAPAGTRMPLVNSVLASGSWFKFKVEQTGVYRLTKDFLDDLGMDTENLDPRTIKIYGFGGKPLRLANDLNTATDLPENAIKVLGEEDGSFDSGDSVLFYGVGVFGYDVENDTHLNPYSNDAYYFITSGGNPGLRIQPMVEPGGNTNITFSSFQENQFIEEDLFNPALVGRQWFGERFDLEPQKSYEFNFPNIQSGSEVTVRVRAAVASETVTSMAVTVNGTALDPISFGTINDPLLLVIGQASTTFNASGETITVDLNYNNNGNPSSDAFLDYITVTASRQLQGNGNQLSFINEESANPNGIAEYQISNASQFSEVWDITNFNQITAKVNEGNSSSFNFKANTGELRKYVAVNPNDYFNPVQASNSVVPNQNLKGTILSNTSGGFSDLDYLIVTSPFLIQPALKLAQHRAQISGLTVKVVTLDKIYNEFSNGQQDISAIRNFVRYIYNNASSPNRRIKYLCMFGDTSVDYKDRLSNNNNIVPTFHVLASTSTSTSYMSDDFFGFLDPTEGINLVNDGLDLAVGRILADNVQLANDMVNKIIEYDSRESYGNWRNNFLLVSDDVDIEWEHRFLQVVQDSIGDRVTREKPYINVKKIHADAFEQVTSAGGNRYPKVNDQFIDDIEVGSLITNYLGHGGEDGMAKEFIYTKTIAQNLENQNRYTCLVTVTCELTKFDNPLRETAGELTYWNRTGGAISLITTTRSIGVQTAVALSNELTGNLFGFGTPVPVPPAEALRITKNDIGSRPDKRVVFFIGDPAQPLAFPKQSVRITHLNDQPIKQATDTLKALSKVRFRGEVVDEQGNLQTNYSGIVEARVFDKDVQRQTLGNDGIRDSNGDLLILNFKTLGESLFNGQATVTNGTFEFEFVVPRDVQVPVGNGKVSLYSSRTNVLEDQTGFNLDIQVGGINENAPEDTQGPTIRLFMNDESFVSGGITNDSPFLIAKLEDENGINTASGIGHDIVAILDGDESNPFVLNEYYQAEVDDFTRGEAAYKLRSLEDGLHTLTLKAWDVYNNSSTAEIQFLVAGNDQLEITRVLNYPNPFVNYTEFWFNHNRPFEPLEVQVQVFTVTGKVVWTQNQIINTDGFLAREIIWDGKDDFGDRIGKGVYVYKLTVKSSLTGQQVEKFEKLVIL